MKTLNIFYSIVVWWLHHLYITQCLVRFFSSFIITVGWCVGGLLHVLSGYVDGATIMVWYCAASFTVHPPPEIFCATRPPEEEWRSFAFWTIAPSWRPRYRDQCQSLGFRVATTILHGMYGMVPPYYITESKRG